MNKIALVVYVSNPYNKKTIHYAMPIYATTSESCVVIDLLRENNMFLQEDDYRYAEVKFPTDTEINTMNWENVPYLKDWQTQFDATSTAELLKRASMVDTETILRTAQAYFMCEDDIRHFLYEVAEHGHTINF